MYADTCVDFKTKNCYNGYTTMEGVHNVPKKWLGLPQANSFVFGHLRSCRVPAAQTHCTYHTHNVHSLGVSFKLASSGRGQRERIDAESLRPELTSSTRHILSICTHSKHTHHGINFTSNLPPCSDVSSSTGIFLLLDLLSHTGRQLRFKLRNMCIRGGRQNKQYDDEKILLEF